MKNEAVITWEVAVKLDEIHTHTHTHLYLSVSVSIYTLNER